MDTSNINISDSEISKVINKAESLPKYTEHCKFVLIEELALEEDYRLLHYGKCSVIGKLGRNNQSGCNIFGNIKIPSLPGEYSIPENALQVELDLSNCLHVQLQNGHYYEVVGEVILKATNEKDTEPIYLTSRSVCEQLLALSDALNQDKLLKYFLNTYKPVIKVWFATAITSPSELIAHNLELRIVQNKIESFYAQNM